MSETQNVGLALYDVASRIRQEWDTPGLRTAVKPLHNALLKVAAAYPDVPDDLFLQLTGALDAVVSDLLPDAE